MGGLQSGDDQKISRPQRLIFLSRFSPRLPEHRRHALEGKGSCRQKKNPTEAGLVFMILGILSLEYIVLWQLPRHPAG